MLFPNARKSGTLRSTVAITQAGGSVMCTTPLVLGSCLATVFLREAILSPFGFAHADFTVRPRRMSPEERHWRELDRSLARSLARTGR